MKLLKSDGVELCELLVALIDQEEANFLILFVCNTVKCYSGLQDMIFIFLYELKHQKYNLVFLSPGFPK